MFDAFTTSRKRSAREPDRRSGRRARRRRSSQSTEYCAVAVARAARRRSRSARWHSAAAPAPAQLDLAHVAHVEEAAALAHGAMLVERAAVRHRHVPAGELDDARAERAMALVERRCAAAITPRAPRRPLGGASPCWRAASRPSSARRRPAPGVICAGALARRPRTRRRRAACRRRPIDADVDHDRAGRIHSPRTSPAWPAAATTTSARPTSPARSARARVADGDRRVPLEQQQRHRLADQHAPADHDRARAPQRRRPPRRAGASRRAACTGAAPACPARRRPWLTGCSPSTSFAGGIASITACASRPSGSGSCTRMPCTRASCPSSRTSSSSSACVVAGRQPVAERRDADLAHACSLLPDVHLRRRDRRRRARSPARDRCRARPAGPRAPAPRLAPPPQPPCRRSSVPRELSDVCGVVAVPPAAGKSRAATAACARLRA